MTSVTASKDPRSQKRIHSGTRLQGFWGYIGVMENNMEATTMGYIGFRVRGFGL